MTDGALTAAVASIGTMLVGAAIIALARWISGATRREGASDVASATVATALARMETKLDQLGASIGEMREARVRIETEHASTVERITRAEDRLAALSARVDQADAGQTAARHAQTAHLATQFESLARDMVDRALAKKAGRRAPRAGD